MYNHSIDKLGVGGTDTPVSDIQVRKTGDVEIQVTRKPQVLQD